MPLVNGSWRAGFHGAGTTLSAAAVVTRGSDVYVGGEFHLAGDVIVHNLARWDGSTWHAVGGGTDSLVNALAFDNAGHLYVAGGFSMAGGTPARAIAKWDGTSWSALGSGIAFGEIRALAVDPAGNVYVGGRFTSISGVSALNIATWNGSTWSALGAGCNDLVICLAFDSASNALYAGGFFTNAGGVVVQHVARWQNGAWSALGDRGAADAPVWALTLASDGVLFVGGDGVYVQPIKKPGWPGTEMGHLSAWNPATAQWSDLGAGLLANTVYALLLVEDRYLHVGGSFFFTRNFFGEVMEVWNYGVVDTKTKAWGPMGYMRYAGVDGLSADGAGNIYAVGDFDQVQNVVAHNVAMWNGSVWSALGEADSVDGPVLALASDGAGNTYVGPISWAGVQKASRDPILPATEVAKWNGSTWSTLPPRPPYWYAGGVRSMALDSTGVLYAGGDDGSVSRWSGTSWSLLGQRLDNQIFAVAARAGGNLYVGGPFLNAVRSGAPNIAVNYLAAWDGATFAPVDGGTNNCVAALALDAAGGLYAGGFFTTAGGLNVNYIAHWNGTSWSALAGGTNGPVFAVAIAPNGNVYIGGQFTTAGGVAANRVARWDGTAWSALGSGVSAVDACGVQAIVIDDLGTVVVAGSFSSAGGIPASNIAKWNGTTWSALDTGMNDAVYALALDSGGNLAAGGDFSTAGANASCFFAYYTANPSTGSPNPPGSGPPPPPPGIQPVPKPLLVPWWIAIIVARFNEMMRILTNIVATGLRPRLAARGMVRSRCNEIFE
jgi:hypothetical protein